MLNFGKWEGPKTYQVNVQSFSNIPLATITKLKVRRKYEPHSKELPADSMIMKVCCGSRENYYTATI